MLRSAQGVYQYQLVAIHVLYVDSISIYFIHCEYFFGVIFFIWIKLNKTTIIFNLIVDTISSYAYHFIHGTISICLFLPINIDMKNNVYSPQLYDVIIVWYYNFLIKNTSVQQVHGALYRVAMPICEHCLIESKCNLIIVALCNVSYKNVFSQFGSDSGWTWPHQ